MQISILHLSDIHFIKDRNVAFQRRDKIFDAIKNEIKGKGFLFIITSGDIAYSGNNLEYSVALDFYKYLYKKIEEYTDLKSCLLFVPGNHDCLFNTENDNVRKIILKNFATEGLDDISEDLIEICCKPQENFFSFVDTINKKLHYNGDSVFNHKLLDVKTFKIDEKVFKINCYNTSWDSLINEKIGGLKFPIDYLNSQIPSVENYISISLVHHPFNWQSISVSKDFRDSLAKTSEIIISGHEHSSSESIFSDLEQQYNTIHIESGALQESNNDRDSHFNIINIDTESTSLQIIKYSFDLKSAHYVQKSTSEWKHIEKNKKLKSKPFQLKKEYLDKLENAGASFTHQNVDEIKLSDIYISPIFNSLAFDKINKSKFINFIHSETALEFKPDGSKFFKLILGSEGCGKTALLKHNYLKFYSKDYFPVYLPAELFTEVKSEKIKKIVAKEFKIQYHELEEKFEQIDYGKIILLIDDLHIYNHKKSKVTLIKNLIELFDNIIITGSEIMLFETYSDQQNKTVELFESFDQYIIQEFNPTLRNQLINKWYRLGKEYLDTAEKNEFFKQVDLATQNINTIIGKNLIPAYPIFILSILQASESGQSDSTSNNLHAYYYEMLITRSLRKKLKEQDDIGFYMTLAKEFFYFLFKEKIRFKPISKESFYKFLKHHSEKYDLSNLNFEAVLQTLNDSRIVKTNTDDTVSVSYKYLYYYFVAKYLSDDIDSEDVRTTIDRMTDRLYREEYSNIIHFLTHLSKNSFIINKLIEKSRKIFEGIRPIKLEEDIDFINNLQKELPEQILSTMEVEDIRAHDLKEEDDHELNEKEEELKLLDEQYDLEDDVNSIDLISMVTKALRTLNILGQITKKYWGELLAEDKYSLAEETYLLGLRTLKFNFDLLEVGKNALSEHIVKIIKKKFIKDKLSKEEIEAISANYIFTLSNASTFGVLKRIVNAVGTKKLSNTFDDIKKAHPFNSVMLINNGIKLDHYKGFPIEDIEELKKKNIKNPLAFTTLQNFVIDHFYMYPVEYDLKQKVCDMLNIKIQDQRFIAQTSQIMKA